MGRYYWIVAKVEVAICIVKQYKIVFVSFRSYSFTTPAKDLVFLEAPLITLRKARRKHKLATSESNLFYSRFISVVG